MISLCAKLQRLVGEPRFNNKKLPHKEICLNIALSRMKERNLIKFHPNFYVYLQSVLLGKYHLDNNKLLALLNFANSH